MAGGFGSFLNDIGGTAKNFGDSVTSGQIFNPLQNIKNAIGTYQNYGDSALSTLNDAFGGRPGSVEYKSVQPVSSSTGTNDSSKDGSSLPDPTGLTTGGTGYSQAEIDAIDASLQNALADYLRQYQNAQTGNAATDKQAAADHTYQVQQNNMNHENAIHNALTAASLGGQGLRNVLASLGALGGTGAVLANRAVANSSNNDIGNADQTYQTNAADIGSAWNAFNTDKDRRDAALESAYKANQQNAQREAIQNKMDIYKGAGATSLYNSLLPQLTATTAPTTQLAAAPSIYNRANISQFAPPSNLTVRTSGGASQTPVNSALYVTKRKDDNS